MGIRDGLGFWDELGLRLGLGSGIGAGVRTRVRVGSRAAGPRVRVRISPPRATVGVSRSETLSSRSGSPIK